MTTDSSEGRQSFDDGPNPSPPTPDGVPILGNGVAFSRDPVGAMGEWAELGDVVEVRTPGRSTYMITGPALIERILVDDHDRFTLSPAQRETFAGVEDHAVTTTTGERWKRLRRAMHPAFTRDAIAGYADRMARTTADVLDGWLDGERIDLYRAMRRLTVTVLADTLLDADVRGRERVVMDAADALVDRANFRRPGQFLPDWVPTPTDLRFRRAVGELDDFVDDLIADRRRRDAGEDVCSVLLAAHEDGDLTIEEVRHNLVALLLAGHDSPATALTTTWLLLADHLDARVSLREEADAVLPDDPNETDDRPIAEIVEDLEYTRRVVQEALRLYPPTLGISRQATEPVTLDGYELPAGAEFLLPQRVVHRDERFWNAPDEFRPERWRDADDAAAGDPDEAPVGEHDDRPTYAYFPFSGGPRNCIGMHFARQELTIALATIARRVELDVTVDGPLTFTPSVQLRPEPAIEATVTRRAGGEGS